MFLKVLCKRSPRMDRGDVLIDQRARLTSPVPLVKQLPYHGKKNTKDNCDFI